MVGLQASYVENHWSRLSYHSWFVFKIQGSTAEISNTRVRYAIARAIITKHLQLEENFVRSVINDLQS